VEISSLAGRIGKVKYEMHNLVKKQINIYKIQGAIFLINELANFETL
jgi:hypothetical protein